VRSAIVGIDLKKIRTTIGKRSLPTVSLVRDLRVLQDASMHVVGNEELRGRKSCTACLLRLRERSIISKE
jgi:hypothetical protein